MWQRLATSLKKSGSGNKGKGKRRARGPSIITLSTKGAGETASKIRKGGSFKWEIVFEFESRDKVKEKVPPFFVD